MIVARLRAHGTRRVFTVAGESYLDVLDAFFSARNAIQVVTCRHEAAAANMAEATGKLTGRPGVAFVTRGPGLTHASIGVHTAKQDATPLVLFVGEIARDDRFRHAFQEVDLARTFADLAKGVVQIDRGARAGELVDRAFQLALSGRPGPVIVGLPEDVLAEVGGEIAGGAMVPVSALAIQGVSPGVVAAIAARLSAAERPLLWLGGSQWSEAGVGAVRRLAEAWSLPAVTGFRRKDLFPNEHRCYAGELGFGAPAALIERVRSADLLLVLGAALGDVETGGYQWLDRALTQERLIHVHLDGETLGAVYPAAIAVQASPGLVAAELAALEAPTPASRGDRDGDGDGDGDADRDGNGDPVTVVGWTEAARAAQVAFMEPVDVGGKVNLSLVVRELRAQLPESAIVTNGAGNYAAWLHRFFAHRGFPTQLAPGSGAMGYAVPAAIAAKLQHPEREVVAVAGDGCFLMSSQELATAAGLGLRIVFVVVNNGSYGTIRMHQESRFPGRRVATDLANPDFVALARAFGLAAWRVTESAEFPAALAAARVHTGPGLIELVTSIKDISPGRQLPA